MKLKDWLDKHPHGTFRASVFHGEPGKGVGFTPLKPGDVLCVSHGPWMYLFGISAVERGLVAEHELLALR